MRRLSYIQLPDFFKTFFRRLFDLPLHPALLPEALSQLKTGLSDRAGGHSQHARLQRVSNT